jgi:16S rRNA (cytidine1402-2'-O)-methyltransferase
LPRRISCFVGNEHERVKELLDALARGETVAFVSEAGLPVWSDPGRLLVQAAADAGHLVDVIPGPTAASVALVASGFEATGARFVGFLPRGGAERTKALERLVSEWGPSIVYEAGNRVAKTLADLAAVLPDPELRRILMARELTKAHQELVRGTVAEVAARVSGGPVRGEVTLVLEGLPEPTEAPDPAGEGARAVFEAIVDPDLRPRERAKRIAAVTGIDAREVYDRLSTLLRHSN